MFFNWLNGLGVILKDSSLFGLNALSFILKCTTFKSDTKFSKFGSFKFK
jgi:hypothetical protein